MRTLVIRTLALMMAYLLVLPPSAHAYIIPTISPANLATTLAQIGKVAQQIQKMSSLIGAAKTQINKLQEVSDGIRNLKNVVSGGAQGLLGSVADELGLKDVFTIGKALQSTFSEGYQLYKDINSLPDEAKRAIEDVGLSIKDVKEYMAEGLLYDAFSGMGIDQWRDVFKHPMDAFVTGAVGRACDRSGEYLSTEQLQAAYAARMATLSPEERSRLSGSAGVDMFILNMGAWSRGMEKTIADTIQWEINADKLAQKSGEAKTVVDATKVDTAAKLALAKQDAETARINAKSAQVVAATSAAQLDGARKENDREAGKDTAKAMIASEPGK